MLGDTQHNPFGKNHSIFTQATGPKKQKSSSPVVQKQYLASHTAVDVPVFARGPGQEHFTGTMDNTDIPKKILSIFQADYTYKSNKAFKLKNLNSPIKATEHKH